MAESLVKETQLSMKEIAYRTGYSDACHLIKNSSHTMVYPLLNIANNISC